MSDKINSIIQKFIKDINSILGSRIKKIILFGSYARGDFNDRSDIDIMILTDLTDEEIIKYRTIIWDSVADIEIDEGIVISPLLKNINEFSKYAEIVPFYNNIYKEGVLLNG